MGGVTRDRQQVPTLHDSDGRTVITPEDDGVTQNRILTGIDNTAVNTWSGTVWPLTTTAYRGKAEWPNKNGPSRVRVLAMLSNVATKVYYCFDMPNNASAQAVLQPRHLPDYPQELYILCGDGAAQLNVWSDWHYITGGLKNMYFLGSDINTFDVLVQAA